MASTKRIESDVEGLDDVSPAEFIDIPGVFNDVTDIQDDLESQINAITEEFGGEANDDEFKIHVKRILKDKGERAHLFSCLPNELPILDKLRDDYDGGEFEVWIYRNKKIFKRRKVVVEAPKKAIVPLAVSGADNTSVLLEGLNKLGALIVQGNAVKAQPVFDPIASMSAMMQQMVLMKEFVGGAQPQADPLAMIEKVVSIQQMMGGGERSEGATTSDVLLELTRTFGKPIAELTMKAQAEADHQSTHAGAQAAPVVNPTTQQDHPMKMQLMFLLGFARRNVDPSPYAQMVLDQAKNLPELLSFIQQTDCIEKMIEICPKIADHRDWFVELGECIIEFAAVSDDSSTVDEAQADAEVVGEVVTPASGEGDKK